MGTNHSRSHLTKDDIAVGAVHSNLFHQTRDKGIRFNIVCTCKSISGNNDGSRIGKGIYDGYEG